MFRVYTDASTIYNEKKKPGKSAICIVSADAKKIYYEVIEPCNVNMAEAIAVLRALQIIGGELEICTDSLILVTQLTYHRITKNPDLNTILAQIRPHLERCKIVWIERNQNLAGLCINKFRKIDFNPLFNSFESPKNSALPLT